MTTILEDILGLLTGIVILGLPILLAYIVVNLHGYVNIDHNKEEDND